VRQLPWDHGEEHDSNVSTPQPEVAGQTTCTPGQVVSDSPGYLAKCLHLEAEKIILYIVNPTNLVTSSRTKQISQKTVKRVLHEKIEFFPLRHYCWNPKSL
jgi:hypothetical protein